MPLIVFCLSVCVCVGGVSHDTVFVEDGFALCYCTCTVLV